MLSAGEQIGPYKLISKLGTGGFGAVWLAEKQTSITKIKVALKIPLSGDVDLEAIKREANLWVQASGHPNVLPIIEAEIYGEQVVIASEYAPDGSLDLWLKQHEGKAPSIETAIEITSGILSGLEHLHAQHIIHRDLKPGNILLQRGNPRLADFGLSRILKTTTSLSTKASGTPSYMAPEAFDGKRFEQTDLWAVGVIFYQLLSGHLPFPQTDVASLLGAILTREPEPLPSNIPQHLQQVIKQSLKKKPEERFLSASEMRRELRNSTLPLNDSEVIDDGIADKTLRIESTKVTSNPLNLTNYPTTIESPKREEQKTNPPHQPAINFSLNTRWLKIAISLFCITFLPVIFTIFWSASFIQRYLVPANEVGSNITFDSLKNPSDSNNAPQINSIAVMPFENASGNADTEYLSDGMTETLIGSLLQLPNLKVKARSSVFRYKGKETSAKTIAKELNVLAVLNGRIVQRGEQLTLYVELVDAMENVLWKADYNRQMTNLVSLQTEITRDVSKKLKTKLSGADEKKLAKNYTDNTEAYKLYLQGRFYLNKRTPNDLRKAVQYFQQAIAIDPNYALAHTGLADAYALLSGFMALPPREAMPKAKDAALKALQLDEELAEAHTSLGFILKDYNYDFIGAEREFKRAIELNPNYATAHQWLSEVLSHLGRHEESFIQSQRTVEIDPVSPVFNSWYGASLYYARKYDQAIAQFNRTLELDANFAGAHLRLAFIHQIKANYAEGIEELARFHELTGRKETAELIRKSFAKGGWKGFLRMMTGKQTPSGVSLLDVAAYLAALGEKDEAFAALNQAYENRNHILVYLKVDPRLDPLRDDPRFEELLRMVGFPK